MDSLAQTFTPEQVATIKALLGMTVEKPVYLDTDYSSESESDFDSGCEETHVKRRPGRPKKVRTPEEIAKKEASKARGRGRPKVERTPEQIAEMAAAFAAKEARKQDREAKKLEREAADAIKQQVRVEREAKAEKKAHEKAERELAAKVKRTEIYQKMIDDAEAYKAKWCL